jgi:hypothetical protein
MAILQKAKPALRRVLPKNAVKQPTSSLRSVWRIGIAKMGRRDASEIVSAFWRKKEIIKAEW